MRRILLVMAIALIMAAMMGVMATTAMAQSNGDSGFFNYYDIPSGNAQHPNWVWDPNTSLGYNQPRQVFNPGSNRYDPYLAEFCFYSAFC